MTTFDASAADEGFYFTGTTAPVDAIVFLSQVTANATTYSFLTTTGHLVTATGSFTYPGGVATGTVTSVTINLSNDADTDISISGVANVSIALLLAGNDSFWGNLFAGADSFIGSINGDVRIAGDWPNNAATNGSGDTFTLNLVNGGGTFYGDNFDHVGGVPITGGNDIFAISGSVGVAGTILNGDTGTNNVDEISIGGDDVFTVDTTSFTINVHCDFTNAHGVATGGDDTVTVTAGTVFVVGDASSLDAGVTLDCGDDTVSGATTVYGDTGSFLGGVATGGDDTISGTSLLYGDAGSLTNPIVGAASLACGDDSVSTSDSFASLYGDIGNVDVDVSAVTLVFGNDTMTGGTGGDTIYGDYGIDTLFQMGSAGGNDLIFAGGGADTIRAQGGDDIVDPGTGDDTVVDGGDGRDTISYASLAAAVTVDLTLQGVAQNTIGGGNDTLTNFENILGGSGGDTLTGDGGDNVISGGLGNDVLTGGTNLAEGDTASYAGNVAVTVSLALQGGQQDTLGAGLDTLNGFENLSGSDQGDTLTGNGSANTLSGGGGIDTLSGAGGADTIHGGDGGDFITGGGGGDTLSGDAGNDTFFQINDGAANVIDGGADTDTLVLTGSTIGWNIDETTGYSGAATLALTSIENVTGSGEGDYIVGSSTINVILGAGGDDWIEGGAAGDTLNGGGHGTFGDTLRYIASDAGVTVNITGNTASGGHATGDVISNFENVTGSAFNDVITGADTDNILEGGDDGRDALYGMEGDDLLRGGDEIGAGDNVYGGDGAYRVYGNGGNDNLYGDGGSDELNGGEGNDFLYADGLDTVLDGGSGSDFVHALDRRPVSLWTWALARSKASMAPTTPWTRSRRRRRRPA
ncbi:MAG: hypothetical protein IPL47_16655 [Phyllobacteriaceae bacterium]|nr:hypothetical protein [Phyllobacteriaceae bacterium]